MSRLVRMLTAFVLGWVASFIVAIIVDIALQDMYILLAVVTISAGLAAAEITSGQLQ